MADQSGEKFSFSEAIRANPRGWLVVAFIWIALSVVFSARSALGLMMPEWEKELGWARTFVSTGGSIVLVIMAIVSPVAGNLLDRIGPRLVVTTALAAVGAAILATSAMSTQWQFIVLFDGDRSDGGELPRTFEITLAAGEECEIVGGVAPLGL